MSSRLPITGSGGGPGGLEASLVRRLRWRSSRVAAQKEAMPNARYMEAGSCFERWAGSGAFEEGLCGSHALGEVAAECDFTKEPHVVSCGSGDGLRLDSERSDRCGRKKKHSGVAGINKTRIDVWLYSFSALTTPTDSTPAARPQPARPVCRVRMDEILSWRHENSCVLHGDSNQLQVEGVSSKIAVPLADTRSAFSHIAGLVFRGIDCGQSALCFFQIPSGADCSR
jgi:hypothetical protein